MLGFHNEVRSDWDKVVIASGNEVLLNAEFIFGRPLIIVSQPESFKVKDGKAKFTVQATGDGLKYMWQYQTKTGTKWYDITKSTNNYINVSVTSEKDGYKYRCKIEDENGTVVYSDPANLEYEFITITSQPESYTGDGKVTFKVVAEGDGLTYNWEYKTAKGTKWNSISTSTKSTLTTTVTEAKSGYKYRCKITDASGEVVYSDPATITYGVSKPAAPVITISTVASSGKNKISWDAVDGAEKYYIYCKETGGSYKYLTYRTSTSYTHTAGEPGVCYYYKIAAVNSDGVKSDYSNVKYRTCDLARPVITTSNVASSGKIKVSWDAVDGASKYYIYRSTSKNGEFGYVYATTKTSYTNTGAEAGTAYYYKVKAVHENTTANSVLSAYSGRTCDLARPVVDIALNSKGKLRLTWDAIDGAIEYEIYRSTSKDSGYSRCYTATKTSYTNTGAEACVTYYYKVKAIHSNTNANSAYSYIDSITSE